MDLSNFPPDDVPRLVINGAVATVTLRRPRQHNRIDPGDIAVLQRHFDTVEAASAVRVLVLTGTGDKTFSSGYTIDAIVEKLDRSFEDLLDRLEDFPLPTICALNGSVYGGATDLALCCDYRIGVHGTRMFMPAAKFGLHYYPGGMRRYLTQLGLAHTKRLFLGAQTIEADEMWRIGFLTELVQAGELGQRVASTAEAIIGCEPKTVASIKRQLNQLARHYAQEALSRDDYERSLRSPALQMRIAARGK
ncbi:enoyl-CoA hydratase/isomerase family protein [Massilia sp. LXY-6]|uniref:enoyl-CoA hydratase/isomerase family protein n=1 Tax=Massilia sp. LXY-6 TaxID=3379823 RepID=UPI003EDED36F